MTVQRIRSHLHAEKSTAISSECQFDCLVQCWLGLNTVLCTSFGPYWFLAFAHCNYSDLHDEIVLWPTVVWNSLIKAGLRLNGFSFVVSVYRSLDTKGNVSSIPLCDRLQECKNIHNCKICTRVQTGFCLGARKRKFMHYTLSQC